MKKKKEMISFRTGKDTVPPLEIQLCDKYLTK